MHGPDSLPNRIGGVVADPHSNFWEHKNEIKNEEKNESSHDLSKYKLYNAKTKSIFSLLPNEVWKKNDNEVVIRSDQAAEHSHELH